MFDHLPTGKYWDIGLDLVPGCTHVSPACDHCWRAEKTRRAGCQKNPKIQARYGGLTDAQGRFTGEVRPQWQDGEFAHIRSFDSFQKWVQKAQTWMQKGDICLDLAGRICQSGADMETARYPVAIMRRVGKRAAGRRLDGVEHTGVPELA